MLTPQSCGEDYLRKCKLWPLIKHLQTACDYYKPLQNTLISGLFTFKMVQEFSRSIIGISVIKFSSIYIGYP